MNWIGYLIMAPMFFLLISVGMWAPTVICNLAYIKYIPVENDNQLVYKPPMRYEPPK